MVERLRIVPVSYIVFRRDDRVLLQLRSGTGYMDGYWATAGAGHVESGESAAQAAVREAHEELGISVALDQLVPLTAMHRTTGDGGPFAERVDFFFVCTNWQGEPQPMEPDKTADLRWFDLDALPSALVPHERYIFERLRKGLPPIVSFGFAAP